MNGHCIAALAFLSHAYNRGRGLFSYSSTVDDRGQVVNDFSMPVSLRYTINTYLGLAEAEWHGGQIE